MWILSCDDESLGSKQTWLRPGSECFLGRTSGKGATEGLHLFIEHKSVSRTHLLITVDLVESGDATLLHKSQCIQIEDKSKTGTLIDGERIVKQTRTLPPGHHTVQLGHYQPEFHLKWFPLVLSITNLSKTAKKSDDPLAGYRSKVEAIGVKLTTAYVANITTHVIAKKRNTAIGLQALLQARWLVTDSFVDALAAACDRRPGQDANRQLFRSRLESDFTAAWPSEEDYIVPVGEEPTKRPNEYLRPRPERGGIFHDFTFVFLSQAQYDQLLPVVTTGGGKATLCQYRPDETSVADVVKFVADLAGSKYKTGFQLSQQHPSGENIVVIRIGDASLGRSVTFMRDLDIALDQRSMEQSEFFGAIVDNDATSLRQPLRDASQDSKNDHSSGRIQEPPYPQSSRRISKARSNPTDLAEGEDLHDSERRCQDDTDAPPKKRPRRLVTQSRFKGFDDFDPSQIAREASSSPETPSVVGVPASIQEINEESGDKEGGASQNMSKKRKAPQDDARDEDQAMLDELLPGMKRRRTEALKTGAKQAAADSFRVGGLLETVQSKPKKSFLEKDIKAEIKKRREKEEEERRKDEESLQNALDVDIRDLKDLAKIETFELPVRNSHAAKAISVNGREWNPAWDGRKNFKKFRPKGTKATLKSGLEVPKVLVRLEEVSRGNGASGEDYWLQSNPSERVQSNNQSQSQVPSTDAAVVVGTDDEASMFTFQRRRRRKTDEVVEDSVPAQATAEELSGPSSTTISSQTLGSERDGKAPGKRSAAKGPMGAPPTKRIRTGSGKTATNASDDEDPLAFTRRRR